MSVGASLPELFRSPIFENISQEKLATLIPLFKLKTFEEGATIFVENMEGESLYLIEKGTIKVSKMIAEGDEQVMVILGPDDVFGEMAVFAGGCRTATARVAERASMFTLSRDDYDSLAEWDPPLCLQLTRNIISIFSGRVRESQKAYRQMLLTSVGRQA
ncbi:MAG: hypothetical protein C0618_00930 [Desulfuromonas sp.]|nr:MAG: hypothetical protein C0618_00930 [Desulfuromonas sp.]